MGPISDNIWIGDMVINPHIESNMGDFHHQVDQCLKIKQLRRYGGRICSYSPLVEEMMDSGLEEVDTYISLLQNTVG